MIGHFRHRITFQEQVETPDGGGGYDLSWQNIAEMPTVWARIIPLSGSERLAAQRLESRITHRIRIRYRAGITPDLRAAFKGRTFNIRAVINVEEKNRFLDLLAEEGVAV